MAVTSERFIAELRTRGLRITPARRAIVSALLRRAHPTADSLVAAVRKRHPDVAPSTVYRFLESLEDEGLVRHSHLGHGPAVYHLAEDHHAHLVCERCGIVTEIPHAAFAALRRKLRENTGFEVSPGHFAVTGLCKGCRRSAGE